MGLGLVVWWSGGGKLIGGRVWAAQQTPITSITDTSHFTLKPPSFSKWGTTSNALCVQLTLWPNQSDSFITRPPLPKFGAFPAVPMVVAASNQFPTNGSQIISSRPILRIKGTNCQIWIVLSNLPPLSMSNKIKEKVKNWSSFFSCHDDRPI